MVNYERNEWNGKNEFKFIVVEQLMRENEWNKVLFGYKEENKEKKEM